MFRAIVVLVGGLVLFHAAAASAQQAVLGQEYGSGVHSFFAGDYAKAHEQLTAAIAGGSQDPRAFYFRGLAYLNLGRPAEATADFRKGAELESKDVNKFFDVGKSLERVQGAGRLELENYRVAARMTAYEQAERQRKARYEALQREESRVVREQSQGGAEEPGQVEPPPAPGDETDPFATPGEKPAAPGAKSGDETDPFAAPAEKPAEKPAAPPKADKPAEKKEKKGSLIGGIGRAIEKGITGDKKPAEGKNETKPAEKKPAADDPFAEQPAKEPAKKPAEKPAEKPEAKKPDAKKPAEDDPFKS
jgi:tetratricopeptide (TPR) repeat protein